MYRLSHEKRQQMNDKAKADLIPTVTVSSGEKFVTPPVVHAIKDGIKTAKETAPRLKSRIFCECAFAILQNTNRSKTSSNSTDWLPFAKRQSVPILASAGQLERQLSCSWATFARVPADFAL